MYEGKEGWGSSVPGWSATAWHDWSSRPSSVIPCSANQTCAWVFAHAALRVTARSGRREKQKHQNILGDVLTATAQATEGCYALHGGQGRHGRPGEEA